MTINILQTLDMSAAFKNKIGPPKNPRRADGAPPGPGFHLAFNAASPDAVDRFHAPALAAGGTCNGPPGLRPRYSPAYYAAFVIDPDGYRLEAVHQ
jgi:catechol 2,3-dioxygenase-like lactoylglutathione lyase family enzyme